MTKRNSNRVLGMLALGLGVFLTWLVATESRGAAVAGTSDYIGGVVTSSKGPEAGVWVIAETTELPTKYAKIVVTDDQGRYVLPELPTATYQVFVRGYGLVDSARSTSEARPTPRSQSRCGARRAGGRADLSGQLLVEPRENTEWQAVTRRSGRKNKALYELSSAWGQGDTRDSCRHQGIWSV